jgi:hypothetical protein
LYKKSTSEDLRDEIITELQREGKLLAERLAATVGIGASGRKFVEEECGAIIPVEYMNVIAQVRYSRSTCPLSD